MLRMYLRKQDVLGRREFVSIGWYCDKCKVFDCQLDQEALFSYRLYRYRIYTRSRNTGRTFIPFAYYYPEVKLFSLDDSLFDMNSRVIRGLKMKFNTESGAEALVKALEYAAQKREKS
jgi:hypothetical protein